MHVPTTTTSARSTASAASSRPASTSSSACAASCARRPALEVTSLRLRGTISWTDFGPRAEDWLGFVFLADAWRGEPPAHNDEGGLIWVPRTRLLAACDADPAVRQAAGLVLWDGDRHFLPLVFDDDPRPFHGTMPYAGDRAVGWTYERL